MPKKSAKKKVIAEYEIYLDKKLGSGSYGNVFEGLNLKTNERVAVKMIENSKSMK